MYTEHSTRESQKQLRFTIKRALNQIQNLEIATVAFTMFHQDINGYVPNNAPDIMLQEAVDTLLQVETSKPIYSLRNIKFTSENDEEVEQFAKATSDIAHTVQPHLQLVPAPVYHSQETRRLIEFDESVLKFCSQYSKITYKKHSSVKISKRKHWIRNIKPFIWRCSRVNDPPPLLLYKKTGIPASKQYRARPFYKGDISHTLFPNQINDIKGFKMAKTGYWKATTKSIPIYIATKRN